MLKSSFVDEDGVGDADLVVGRQDVRISPAECLVRAEVAESSAPLAVSGEQSEHLASSVLWSG